MPKFKTPKNKRDTYTYRDAYGRVTAVLHPGEDGVTQEHITYLHRADDNERNAASRDSYYGLYHYDQAGNEGEGIPADRQLDLADYAADPETQFLTEMKRAAVKTIWDDLQPQQRELVLKLIRKRTKVDIATEEGVSEAAIRDRLAKIQNKFKIFLK